MNAPDPNPSHVDLREATPTPVKLVEYSRYVDAQRAVDTLSDEKFQMNGVTIVWSGLRKVEHVTGRRTVATAARDGLMSGAWFGLIIGLLFSAFTEGSESTIATVLIYSIVGAITNRLRNRARPTSTWFGGMPWSPRAFRVRENTMMILVKLVSIRISDGAIENVYRLLIANGVERERGFTMEVSGLPGIRIDSEREVRAEPSANRLVAVRVRADPDGAAAGGMPDMGGMGGMGGMM
mgnify:CR=1 FL=1